MIVELLKFVVVLDHAIDHRSYSLNASFLYGSKSQHSICSEHLPQSVFDDGVQITPEFSPHFEPSISEYYMHDLPSQIHFKHPFLLLIPD